MNDAECFHNNVQPAHSSQGFEEVLSSANVLNRKLEEVYGVGKEFQTVANLWGVSEARYQDAFDPLTRKHHNSNSTH